ncbi:hypothetical protein LOTGIDRAFT_155607 [Lottia gigantea]|uniref:Cysteine and histidine-rich domain-containing protein 1 n=1 Tax=Lottia gigantea TaxID=225164 RepID=V3ZJ30_LOTGI|nr:hypothetical protein LOTGIDRAFT_155607 [Lottia gigantea]ESO84272.1 hypothetical protein LOTGIDRAFT_155607 [Lottia gigantea]
MAEDLLCYNKGCGKKFDKRMNETDSCQYHPGGPIFHDALKGWSCCKKRSTDFTEFLNIPGCTKGKHSNEKPPEPVAPHKPDKNTVKEEVVVVKAPLVEDIKARQTKSDKFASDKLKPIKITVANSLKTALDKLSLESNNDNNIEGNDESVIEIGTSCKNNACGATYEGEASNEQTCTSHPGQPVFHEGMKYWTCCQRKTSDFDNFLAQEGCNLTKHVWRKQKVDGEELKSCRFDWHQTSSNVCLSIFAKTVSPEKSTIEINKVTCKLHLVFDGGKSVFDKTFHFSDIIIPEKSEAKMMGTKVEVNLRKQDCFSWPLLERSSDNNKLTIRQLGDN